MTEPAGSTAQGKPPEKTAPAPKASPSQKDKPTPAPESRASSTKTSKKRRKVNHACIYCRRSHMTCDLERPCTRCIKRGIGHLCHDEPRESVKRSKSEPEGGAGENTVKQPERPPLNAARSAVERRTSAPDAGPNLAPPPLPPPNRASNTTTIAQPTPVPAPHMNSLFPNSLLNLDLVWGSAPNNFGDMHHIHPSMFNTSEVSDEYNLLNSFLSNSLMDDNSGLLGGMDFQTYMDPSFNNVAMADTMYNQGPPANAHANAHGNARGNAHGNAQNAQEKAHGNTQNNSQLLPPPAQLAAGNSIQRPASGVPIDMAARERYYKTAADPAGTDSPEERMNKMLKAKMDAGLLKPFNYVKGYASLNAYMEQNLQPLSRMRIIRQLDKFRPKFRERMQSLTDVELVRVEMWFDKTLMEYDRVFASMAMPACCWRRTGEIFRGNREMAELINVPMSRLRDGNLALHHIIAEKSLVSYWDKFGAIAFEENQKAILTTCSLKNPDPNSKDSEIKCCFSFTIKRDMYKIPAMIVGNFLPIIEPEART